MCGPESFLYGGQRDGGRRFLFQHGVAARFLLGGGGVAQRVEGGVCSGGVVIVVAVRGRRRRGEVKGRRGRAGGRMALLVVLEVAF